MEPTIIDYLTELEEKIVDIKKTTRVVRAGRKFSFRVSVLIGNKDGYIGLGTAKDKETSLAIKKAATKARLNIRPIMRGCGGWECNCNTNHSIPIVTTGKCASVRITLVPAPKGTGLVVGENIKDVFRFAGIQDIWSQTRGDTRTKINFVKAAIAALTNIKKIRVSKATERLFMV